LLSAGTELLAFSIASLVLAITPGPGVFYIVARSVAHGRAVGLVSVAGVAAGNLANAALAAAGLAVLLASLPTLALGVRWCGAAYLIYLGIRSWRAAGGAPDLPGASSGRRSLWRVARDGVVVAALNPKTTLFFSAFLPQFVHGPDWVASRLFAYGALFVAIAALTDGAYAWLASGLARDWLRGLRPGLWARRLSGATLVTLGVLSAGWSGSPRR